MWQVIGDRWHATHDIWDMPHDSWGIASLLTFQLPRHNCFKPLQLPSHCSCDLYNGIWLYATQKHKNVFDSFSESFHWKAWSGIIFFCVKPNFQRCLMKKLLAQKKNGTIFYKTNPSSPLSPPLHMGGKILKIPLVSLMSESTSMCQSCITSNWIKKNSYSWFYPQAYRGGGRCQKLALDGATDFQ